ncbi:MAG: hypothetical protein HPY83_10385 [Anaerolineae bacterium]|nr:hypothetical protein [Anaerolineae bacterium]
MGVTVGVREAVGGAVTVGVGVAGGVGLGVLVGGASEVVAVGVSGVTVGAQGVGVTVGDGVTVGHWPAVGPRVDGGARGVTTVAATVGHTGVGVGARPQARRVKLNRSIASARSLLEPGRCMLLTSKGRGWWSVDGL